MLRRTGGGVGRALAARGGDGRRAAGGDALPSPPESGRVQETREMEEKYVSKEERVSATTSLRMVPGSSPKYTAFNVHNFAMESHSVQELLCRGRWRCALDVLQTLWGVCRFLRVSGFL